MYATHIFVLHSLTLISEQDHSTLHQRSFYRQRSQTKNLQMNHWLYNKLIY